jgi:hypothetical protein
MNTERRPYAERKFLVVVRDPGLLEQVVDFGTWVVVPIVKIGWEAYEKIKQRGLPALIQVTASDVTSLVFPPGHPEINTIYTAHPIADSPRYYETATFHHRSDKSLQDLAEMYNPCIRGWINGRHRSRLPGSQPSR